MDETQQRLQRMAASAKDPADREWARAKHQEMYGMAAAREEVPESLKPTVPLNPMEAALRRPKPEEPGLLERFGKQLKTEVRGIGAGLGLPIDASPDEREIADRMEVVSNKVGNIMTLGLGPAATDAVGLTDPQRRAELDAKYPKTAYGAELGGSAASALVGPARAAGAVVERGVANVAPKLAGSLQGRLGMPAVTGAILGSQDGVEGAASGAAIGAASGAIPAAASAARKTIQEKIPWVGRYARAKEAGLLPQAEALPKGREGVVKASEQARDKILKRQGDLNSEASGKYAAVEAAEAGGEANLSAVRSQLQKLREGNMLSGGTPISKALDDEISGMESLLMNASTNKDLLAIRRSLQERANFANKAPTDREESARKLYEAFRQGVREGSPKLAAADDEFSAVMTESGKTNELLGSSKGKPIKTRQQKTKAAAELEYLDDESIPALRRKGGLEELRQQDPGYAGAMDELGAKKALEATRFSLEPGVRTSLTPAISGIPLIGPATKLLEQQGRFGGRLLDQSLRAPEALGAQGMSERLPGMSLSLIDAIMAGRRRQENR